MTNMYIDLDGTLIDVRKRFYETYSCIMRVENQETLGYTDYLTLRLNHVPLKEILEKTRSQGIYGEFIRQRNQLFESMEMLDYDKLIPGVKDTLGELRKKHVLTMVTNRDKQENLFKQLEWFGLRTYFVEIMVGSQFGGWEAKQKLISSSGEPPIYSMIVGDTEADIKAGKNLGIKTCGVLTGMRARKLLVEEEPDYLIKDFNKIFDVLETEDGVG